MKSILSHINNHWATQKRVLQRQMVLGRTSALHEEPSFLRAYTWGCGVLCRVHGVTCAASSVIDHFTVSMAHFSDSQRGTERPLNRLHVNMTRSVPDNTCGWDSTTSQHLNLDFDGGRSGRGSAMVFTLYDRTVNLDNVMNDPLIIYSTAILRYSYAPCTSKSRRLP